jgi:hypothetical protein
MRHYTDLSAMLRTSQQRIRTALQAIQFPTSRAPWRLAGKDSDPLDAPLTGAKISLDEIVRRALQPIADDVDKEAVRRGDLRDQPAQISAVFSRCPSWYGIGNAPIVLAHYQ